MKFAPDGKVIIRARSLKNQLASKRTSMIEFCIADTGRGIEPSQLESIFTRFLQEEEYLRRILETSQFHLNFIVAHDTK